jgi:quercetin dioxygenase-like cupin family protein
VPTNPLAIPKGLIDSIPAAAVLLDLGAYYAARQLPEAGVDSEVVFDCPRAQVMVRTAVKGTAVGCHYHSVSDEIVVVTGGSGELLVNGVWRPVRRGDVHVCPRGVVHDTRALAENLQYLSIFTPHLPPGGDINWVDAPPG